jgi:hypothetical protein
MALNPQMNRRSPIRWIGLGTATVAFSRAVRAANLPKAVSIFFNWRDHGATRDGETNDTAALQAAISACAAVGGGIVVFPSGIYLSGTLVHKSHVVLWLQSGAVYYDADVLNEVKGWRNLARRTKNVSGFMYTPWQKKGTLLPAFGEMLWSERWRGRRNADTIGLINHIHNLARYESRFRIGTVTNRRLKNEDKNQKRSETNQPRKISR